MLPQKQQPLVRPMVDTPHLIASLAAVITAVIACLIAPDKLIVFRHKTEQDTLDRKFVKRITAVFAIGTAACAAVLMHHSTLIDGILLSLIAILCGVIAIVDTRVRIIPNICSYPMLLIELIYLLMHTNMEGLLIHIGTGLSFALMILIAIRIAGHGEVIGTGDLKLLTIVGFLFGTSTSTIIMLVTMIVLMLMDVLPGIITKKRSFKDMLPMAPFLVPGILLGLCYMAWAGV